MDDPRKSGTEKQVVSTEDSMDQSEPDEVIPFPLEKPSFISLRHFSFMSEYFKRDRLYDPRWLKAYAMQAEGQLQVSDWILHFNEFVLLNQVSLYRIRSKQYKHLQFVCPPK